MQLTLSDSAELVRKGARTFLKVGSAHYGWDEIVPVAVYGPSANFSGERRDLTAGEFVIECMTKLHRPGELWPALAIAFLYDIELSGRSTPIRTLRLTNEAELVLDVDGTFHVLFRSASYSRDDIVPPEIFPPPRPSAWPDRPYILPKSAGDFVTACMVHAHGLTQEWPDIVQQFLWPLTMQQGRPSTRGGKDAEAG
jgi:hypothetical protein